MKRHWRRYIYLWINYALYEELETEDVERARQVYEACLHLIPHKKFTFAKVWLMYAHFEVRQKCLGKARKILVSRMRYLTINFVPNQHLEADHDKILLLPSDLRLKLPVICIRCTGGFSGGGGLRGLQPPPLNFQKK